MIQLFKKKEIAEQPKKTLADVFEKLAATGSLSAVDGVVSMRDAENNLPMITDIPNPSGFTAAQWFATYNDELGFEDVGNALRLICLWQYQHDVSQRSGRGHTNRADKILDALSNEVKQEFMLEKEAKGLGFGKKK